MKNNKNKNKFGTRATTSMVPLIVKDRTITNLHFTQVGRLTNNLQTFQSSRYSLNGVQSPIPGLGSNDIPGFAQWAEFYGKYRVFKIRYDIYAANENTFPVILYTCPTNFDVGDNFGSPFEFYSNKYAKFTLLSRSTGGKDVGHLSGMLSIKQMVGDTGSDIDFRYAAATNTVPLDEWFLNVGIFTTGPSLTTATGATYMINIFYEVEFFDQLLISNQVNCSLMKEKPALAAAMKRKLITEQQVKTDDVS